jgi:hypothetical protein
VAIVRQCYCNQLTLQCTLMMEAIRSSENSIHTRCTRRHVPENGTLPYIDLVFASSQFLAPIQQSFILSNRATRYMSNDSGLGLANRCPA